MQNPQDTEKLNSHTSENSVGLMIPTHKDTGSCSNGPLERGPLPPWSGRTLPAEEFPVAHTSILGGYSASVEEGRVELFPRSFLLQY